jgi:spore germination cell wall hydrolase CwlJ-like protein
MLPLSLPKAGEAKAERPRIRRIGLSPSQYASSPGRLCQPDVNVALVKDSITYSSNLDLKYSKKEKKEKQSTDVMDNADSENIVVKPDDYSSSHKSLPQQHNSLLYSLVQAEAGNQDLDGCRLVADVVLNRIDSEKFPNTMEEVIYAPGQFSVIKNGAFKKAQGEISEKVVQAVDMELSGKRLNYDVLYFNNSNNGGWKYGGHYFK